MHTSSAMQVFRVVSKAPVSKPLTQFQAGASAVDALRSIIISEQLLGTNEIAIVKHTGCGMLTFKDEDAYELVAKNLG